MSGESRPIVEAQPGVAEVDAAIEAEEQRWREYVVRVTRLAAEHAAERAAWDARVAAALDGEGALPTGPEPVDSFSNDHQRRLVDRQRQQTRLAAQRDRAVAAAGEAITAEAEAVLAEALADAAPLLEALDVALARVHVAQEAVGEVSVARHQLNPNVRPTDGSLVPPRVTLGAMPAVVAGQVDPLAVPSSLSGARHATGLMTPRPGPGRQPIRFDQDAPEPALLPEPQRIDTRKRRSLI